MDGLDADDDRLQGLVALGKELGELLLEFLWETSTIRDVVEERHDLSVELADGSVGPLAAVADDLLPSLGERGDGNAETFGRVLLRQLEVLCDLGVPLSISNSDGWDAELVTSFLAWEVALHERAIGFRER